MFKLSGKPKSLVGRIKHARSGIYIDLPDEWNALKIDDNTFLIARSKKEKGGLIFSVNHHVLLKKGKFINPLTGQEEDIYPVKDGEFLKYDLPGGKNGRIGKVWQTETDQYLIRFIFICDRKDMEPETPFVRAIMDSLVKDSALGEVPAAKDL